MCSASTEDIAASDSRRQAINKLKDDIIDFLNRGKIHGAIKMINEVIDLMKLEHLEPLMAEQFETLAHLHWALRQRTKAMSYAEEYIRLLTDHGFMDPRYAATHLAELIASFGP